MMALGEIVNIAVTGCKKENRPTLNANNVMYFCALILVFTKITSTDHTVSNKERMIEIRYIGD